MVRVKKSRVARISQGDILRNVEHIEYVTEKQGNIEVSKILFPLVIVLTQDCDLAQDYKFRWSRYNSKTDDKLLMSVLVAPIYNAEHVYTGEQLSELGLKMGSISRKKTPGRTIRNNETPRFHYLEFGDKTPIVPSIIDFKHYFSVNVAYLKKHKSTNFACQLSELYREDVSQRFTSFMARIGLPG
ncbi:MAG: hypothetical protein D3917_10030 [Candidatus Electrothrix sp. AX5]|nr:hypothetical protein [Candidatus Electrothrix sp. AX5]